jgi:hypothetical protein
LVLGVFGGIGLSLGLVGISGAGGMDGDVGGGGVCCEQPAAIALNAIAANVNFCACMATLLLVESTNCMLAGRFPIAGHALYP